MPEITIYTKEQCPYCTNAKQLLKAKGYPFQEINLGEHPELLHDVIARSGQRTVPQIFVGEVSVGGFTDLLKKTSNGQFEALIQE